MSSVPDYKYLTIGFLGYLESRYKLSDDTKNAYTLAKNALDIWTERVPPEHFVHTSDTGNSLRTALKKAIQVYENLPKNRFSESWSRLFHRELKETIQRYESHIDSLSPQQQPANPQQTQANPQQTQANPQQQPANPQQQPANPQQQMQQMQQQVQQMQQQMLRLMLQQQAPANPLQHQPPLHQPRQRIRCSPRCPGPAAIDADTLLDLITGANQWAVAAAAGATTMDKLRAIADHQTANANHLIHIACPRCHKWLKDHGRTNGWWKVENVRAANVNEAALVLNFD